MSGVSPDLLRQWERRYGSIQPQRDASGRRAYTAEQVERIGRLGTLTRFGYRIGDIVHLSDDELDHVIETTVTDDLESTDLPWRHDAHGVARALEAVASFDTRAIRAVTEEVAARIGRLDIIDGYVFPLVQAVKKAIRSNEMSDAHLGFLTMHLRSVLSGFLLAGESSAPVATVVVASPVRLTNDLGEIATAIHAQAVEWRPVILGGSIDSEEIARTARATDAHSIILTGVVDRYDITFLNEARTLREIVPEDIAIFFGGRMPRRLVEDLAATGLTPIANMKELRERLDAIAA
jgi:DNA-binding transcriptional MerR regulator